MRSRGLCDVGACSGVGLSRLSVGVDGCRGYEPGVLIGADEYFPVAVVDESVVESAQEDEVFMSVGPPSVQCQMW